MTTTTYSINDIKARMRANGSHWWNLDTMESFGTHIESKVYHGPGGVYFVTSEAFDGEGNRKATVRQYIPETNEIGTKGEFNSFEVSTAKLQARALAAGGGPIKAVTTETGKLAKESMAEYIAHLLSKHGGMTCNTTQGRLLIGASTALQLSAEELCNGPADGNWTEAWQKRAEHRQELAVKRAEKLAKEVGAVGVVTGGDPRGASLKLVAPNGWTNDFGREGICIPTRREE